jgi:hypothetical protein
MHTSRQLCALQGAPSEGQKFANAILACKSSSIHLDVCAEHQSPCKYMMQQYAMHLVFLLCKGLASNGKTCEVVLNSDQTSIHLANTSCILLQIHDIEPSAEKESDATVTTTWRETETKYLHGRKVKQVESASVARFQLKQVIMLAFKMLMGVDCSMFMSWLLMSFLLCVSSLCF